MSSSVRQVPMVRELEISILTPKSLVSLEEGREILDMICHICPEIAPDKYGRWEPLRKVFDKDNPEQALEGWGEDFLWKRRRPKAEGSIFCDWSTYPQHSSLNVTIDAKQANVQCLSAFFQEASSRLQADFGFFHFLTEPEILAGGPNGTVFCLDPGKRRYALTVTTHQLVKYLPDLYWATVFGPAYIQHFGRERLLSAPAPIVRDLAGGCIYIQLSASPFDLETDYATVDAVRQQVKAHLDQNSFYDLAALAGHVYNVPHFEYGRVRASKEPDPLPSCGLYTNGF